MNKGVTKYKVNLSGSFKTTNKNYMNTLEGNKLIAEFMELSYSKEYESYDDFRYYWKKESDGIWFNHKTITDREDGYAKINGIIYEEYHYGLKYHKSWDWLMPVVEKIGQYKFEEFEYAFMRTFHSNMARINRFSVHEGETQIEATFKAVVEFIEWYNRHQPVN